MRVVLAALLALTCAQTCPTTGNVSIPYNLNAGGSKHYSTGYFDFSGSFNRFSIMQSFVLPSALAAVNISAFLGYDTLGTAQDFMAYLSTATGSTAAGALIASVAVFVPGPIGPPASPVTLFTGLRRASSLDSPNVVGLQD